jgi:hypothetical protein
MARESNRSPSCAEAWGVQDVSMKPSPGGEALKSGLWIRTSGLSALTAETICRHSFWPSSPCKNSRFGDSLTITGDRSAAAAGWAGTGLRAGGAAIGVAALAGGTHTHATITANGTP